MFCCFGVSRAVSRCSLRGEEEGLRAEAHLAFALPTAESAGCFSAESFVNSIPTADGGVHVDALRSALPKAVSLLQRSDALSTQRTFHKRTSSQRASWTPAAAEHLLDGVVAVVSVHSKNPLFSGQTKRKLAGAEAGHALQKVR